jgi:ABC-2 type transport system permease protein
MSDLAPIPAASAARAPGRASIVRAIAAKELIEMRRDRRLFALFVFTLVLIGAALGFGAAENLRLGRERSAAAEADRQLWIGQGPKNPHAAAHFGQYAFKPVSPLALADPGVNAYVGSAVWLEAHKQNETLFRPASDGGVAARLGGLSLAFILQTIAPLLILLAGFGAFCGERENGTLKQIFSLGARPDELLAGKALALIAGIFALFAPMLVGLAIALLALSDASKLSLADQFIRLGALALGYLAYLLGFVFLTLGVSALAKNSRAALVTLLAYWLTNSFLAPRLATDLTRGLAPTPTAQAFRAGIATEKAATFGHDETHPAFLAFRKETLAKYGVSRIEDLPVNFRGLQLRKDDEIGYAIFDKHFGALQASFDRQDTLRASAGFLFPLLAIQPFSMAFAGADSRAQFDFTTAAEAHRRDIQNEASENIIHFAHDEGYAAGPDLWRRIGAFSYDAPTASFPLAHSGPAITGLTAWLALSLSFALFAARRQRPL